ncbi:DUF935 family protein [Treponema vincentii]|nr:DUF935 family protein [Treponema vincentii]
MGIFADRFGYPVRIGKYGRKATKEDIATLKRAVAIGSDVGAVIPIQCSSILSKVKQRRIMRPSIKTLPNGLISFQSSCSDRRQAEGTPETARPADGQAGYLKADVRQLEQTILSFRMWILISKYEAPHQIY